MNENDANVPEKTPEQIAAEGMAASTDNNAVTGEAAVCGITGVELKEGDEVVIQAIPAEGESDGYTRVVLLSALTDEEREALPEGSVKTFPQLD